MKKLAAVLLLAVIALGFAGAVKAATHIVLRLRGVLCFL